MKFNNIDALVGSARTTLEKRAFTLREGSKYRYFTEKVILRIGDLVSANFFGIDTEFKARIKSPNSTKKKVLKHAKKYAKDQVSSDELLDINEYSLFDIYGGKIVVLSISDNFYSKYLCIDGFLEKRKKSRSLWETAKTVAQKEQSEDKTEISRLSGIIYHEIDTMCQRYVADAICQFIIDNPILRQEFGIFNIIGRFRNYNNQNEYIAKHITLGSTMLPGWYMEVQFKSLLDYDVARTGEAAHNKRDGKSIEVPDNLSEIDIDNIPSYMVYTPNDGLYIPSQRECLFHYLAPVCKNSPKQLLDLFKNFPEGDNGTFKKV